MSRPSIESHEVVGPPRCARPPRKVPEDQARDLRGRPAVRAVVEAQTEKGLSWVMSHVPCPIV